MLVGSVGVVDAFSGVEAPSAELAAVEADAFVAVRGAKGFCQNGRLGEDLMEGGRESASVSVPASVESSSLPDSESVSSVSSPTAVPAVETDAARRLRVAACLTANLEMAACATSWDERGKATSRSTAKIWLFLESNRVAAIVGSTMKIA